MALVGAGWVGAAFALPLGLLAARNVVRPAWLRAPIKRLFDVVRGIDVLIWALIWINVVGLGPFAGVLAVAELKRRVLQAIALNVPFSQTKLA